MVTSGYIVRYPTHIFSAAGDSIVSTWIHSWSRILKPNPAYLYQKTSSRKCKITTGDKGYDAGGIVSVTTDSDTHILTRSAEFKPNSNGCRLTRLGGILRYLTKLQSMNHVTKHVQKIWLESHRKSMRNSLSSHSRNSSIRSGLNRSGLFHLLIELQPCLTSVVQAVKEAKNAKKSQF